MKPFSRRTRTRISGRRTRLAGHHDGRRGRGGIKWYIIEYKKEGVPPLESLKANLELFKKLRSLKGLEV